MPSTSYLTTADVAQQLEITPDTVRRLVAEEGLPAHRIARRLKFTADEVDAWVRTRDASDSGISTAGGGSACPRVDPGWVAAQVAQFTPDDLRRAAQLLLSLADTAPVSAA